MLRQLQRILMVLPLFLATASGCSKSDSCAKLETCCPAMDPVNITPCQQTANANVAADCTSLLAEYQRAGYCSDEGLVDGGQPTEDIILAPDAPVTADAPQAMDVQQQPDVQQGTDTSTAPDAPPPDVMTGT
jgi:hypothetical protein